MLTSNKYQDIAEVTCTKACCQALNSGKGLLSCEERRLCIAIMQNNPVSKTVYQDLLSQVDVDKLIDEGYLIKRPLNVLPTLDKAKSL